MSPVKLLVRKYLISGKKRFFILRLKTILSVVFYERKNIIFYEQNSKLTTNNTFNSVFLIRIFP